MNNVNSTMMIVGDVATLRHAVDALTRDEFRKCEECRRRWEAFDRDRFQLAQRGIQALKTLRGSSLFALSNAGDESIASLADRAIAKLEAVQTPAGNFDRGLELLQRVGEQIARRVACCTLDLKAFLEAFAALMSLRELVVVIQYSEAPVDENWIEGLPTLAALQAHTDAQAALTDLHSLAALAVYRGGPLDVSASDSAIADRVTARLDEAGWEEWPATLPAAWLVRSAGLDRGELFRSLANESWRAMCASHADDATRETSPVV